jgi:hypothetical protein
MILKFVTKNGTTGHATSRRLFSFTKEMAAFLSAVFLFGVPR